jgi:FdrA protein
VISKPPATDVAERVSRHAASLPKPVVMSFLGAGRPDLTAAAAEVVKAIGSEWTEPRRWGLTVPGEPVLGSQPRGYLRGLFSGGTLCDEAMLIAADALGLLSSNIPLPGHRRLDSDLASNGHTFIDFGDDQLTVGRPHPMIDPTLRLERLARELDDVDCGVVLLDVVLGHGAHPDPAADLTPLISASSTPVVISLIGTRDDPQGLDATASRLADAGAVVHASNAAAAREAVGRLARVPT